MELYPKLLKGKSCGSMVLSEKTKEAQLGPCLG